MTVTVKSSPKDRKTIVASCKTMYDAQLYIDVKSFDGWKVLVPPFVSSQDMIDVGEETTRPVDAEWTVVLHRF